VFGGREELIAEPILTDQQLEQLGTCIYTHTITPLIIFLLWNLREHSGVNKLGHRRKILRMLQQLQAEVSATEEQKQE
jgi:hypothetical protein